jgi:light-regulated signal transduction histidine kinase (bacteriophytochrome)
MDKIQTRMIDGPAALNGSDHTDNELAVIQKKMDELIKEINQFTYIITHDLQAPLRMVTGFLELLEKKYAGKLDAGAKQYIDYAMKGSLKMKELVFDLLDYSRLSSVTYEFGEADLNEVLNTANVKSIPGFDHKKIIITHDDLPIVWGSCKLLAQLFSELISNAIKFNNNATIEICIEVNRTDRGWKIAVIDNGIGIDPAYFDKIFQVFRKLHTDEAGYKGSGIGLAICKKIAELHNGTIEVLSQPGKGSTFTLFIPDKKL